MVDGYGDPDPRRRQRRQWGFAVVRGRSMEPTLRAGDRLLVRWGACPRLDRPALVRLPERPLSVKRITGRDGDDWWVERDNPRVGVDSWLVGAIPAADVVAVVVARVWPRPSMRLPRARQGFD
ncbi:MAG TPA: S24/S26 family peptidase [Nocardioidaceae bacterium]|nr:S24/S26 family peptidase [Nocardioidaceae bacterium]